MSRGGMCPNPFGGRTRLDRLDLIGSASASDEPEKILYLQTITDAIHNYLFFGLGRNGTTAEEFAYACEYLFRVRADLPETWKGKEQIQVRVTDDETGKRDLVTLNLSEDEIKGMCFDTHYEYSGLNLHMPFERFLTWLRQERARILRDNHDQVLEYLDYMYEKALSKAKPGHQLPLMLWDRLAILQEPKSCVEVARLVYLPPKYTQPHEEKPNRRFERPRR